LHLKYMYIYCRPFFSTCCEASGWSRDYIKCRIRSVWRLQDLDWLCAEGDWQQLDRGEVGNIISWWNSVGRRWSGIYYCDCQLMCWTASGSGWEFPYSFCVLMEWSIELPY
jgi:hypothetical protein